LSASTEPSPVPAFPGGPDPSKPVPRDPVEGFDLQRYVDLSAKLAERVAPREELLAAAGIGDSQWSQIERTWMLRIATALLQGDQSLALEYDRLYVGAQDALGAGEEPMPIETYAEIVAEIESGGDPAEVYAAHGVSLACAARQQRAWTKRLAEDIDLTDRFRELVKAATSAR
jgi:hypothetical protein